MIKNLIIKSSYSKLPDGKLKSNFGDLIRSTILLNCIKDDFLWFTDLRSLSLLKWFIPVEKTITNPNDLDNYEFTSGFNIYNIDNYVSNINIVNLQGRWHGFIYDREKNIVPQNKMIADIEPYKKIKSCISWQRALIEGMGFSWKKQDYLPSLDGTKPLVDIGLNWKVNPDWKSKHWPMENWKKLESILQKKYSVSWQHGLNNFDEYLKWIHSCKIIVTCDTLGLHLASALRKKVVALTGPTNNHEFPYDRLWYVKADITFDCMPCNSPFCITGKLCVPKIKPEKVAQIVMALL